MDGFSGVFVGGVVLRLFADVLVLFLMNYVFCLPCFWRFLFLSPRFAGSVFFAPFLFPRSGKVVIIFDF